jgi:predicted metal-dependent phosphoesterase TrpH
MSGDRPSGVRLRVDTHVHSQASYDADSPVERILERASDRGLDAVVVTDHDAIDASLRAAALAPEYGLLGLPGVEVSTADGHLLALGVENPVAPGRPLAATVEEVRSRGGVAVVPHPFQRSRHGARAGAIDDCDGIEVYNAHCLTGLRNGQAARFAVAAGYPSFGGSDAHSAELVGRGFTEVRLEPGDAPTGDALLRAMRAGRTRARGRRISMLSYVGKVMRNVRIRGASML